ncbi:MAG: RNA polymerase sigma factor RpoH [Paraperlucidibaca sp.]|jgi:RNA polymerase sigma-32 factor|uniref:RNA polymerase sigma factor RpoH n=1 Tax=Paraperlucidibaca sp. TaxID=2708021 RepID=UPI001B559E7A|nr:RNA polymerase sigma factor RpoH [Paraperlucidibaca sp.]MBQ0723525.1 RNA polymerase sigma factor RpoH [Paraperlucidibaca sp.]MBQ0843048.1 RNA polymerase sigma factor RpoH [Paraperlucidibaca sp.]|tara:strand:+ start:382 stop:1242 length:861 start_codon:yes stop_codon:yes gene_type:complete
MSDCQALAPIAVTVPGVNLGSYIQAANRVAVLSADEERTLAERFHDEQDLDAARQLVLAHLRFVVHIAKSYSGYGLPQADLIQEGNIGLMKAVKRFDPTMGVRLVSFAVHWIKAEIHEYVIKNWRIVKIATTKAQRKLFFNLRSMKKSSANLTLAEAEAIATDLNVSTRDVIEMEGRLLSFDAPIDGSPDDDDERASRAPIHYLEDKRYDPAMQIEASDFESNNSERLMAALDTLDDRSKAILARRWLSEKKATLHELAAEFGISAERIRQLEKNAMDKVRAVLVA